jgi:hypothetical protein
MKVIAIGSLKQALTPEQRAEIMPREVPHTLGLYLEGRIEQFWGRQDQPGPVFLMNVDTIEQARETVAAMPLVAADHAQYELIPVGTLAPLGLLVQGR